ncbi:pyridoxamine 5'-phosphate oxidase family protein [Sulfuriferula thiophila]|uniref:pyridoxamine 5'-phosphate oxidase family protein n=1 Tax=Sulfuriferula thiophila TaxID=1781211 RepID=UPI0016744D17|nr:pyridoxamine 5'-phosphate oxidase family protein [Sulfuriferula thiophila]
MTHFTDNRKIPSDTPLHAGELAAQQRFGAGGIWDAHRLSNMFHEDIPPSLAEFIENLPFFFIATSNTTGECDCSFRGREYDVAGQPYPLVKTLDSRTLVFPDYRGNKLYNSLGNIIVNGHIGMLFIDFQSRRRVRLNGRAEILEAQTAYADVWPLAQRYVRVTTEQVYGNCKSRIPHMQLVPLADSELHDN